MDLKATQKVYDDLRHMRNVKLMYYRQIFTHPSVEFSNPSPSSAS